MVEERGTLSSALMRLLTLLLLATTTRSAKVECQDKGTPGIYHPLTDTDESRSMREVAASVFDPRNGTEEIASNRTYVFLLGYPISGTSASHFLLGTAPQVSILSKVNTLGSEKEGWAIDGFKDEESDRWRNDDDFIPWDRLKKHYLQRWDTRRPLLLENSPPEVLHAHALFKNFKDPGTDVRFLLLTRSPCNQHVSSGDDHADKLRVFKDITEQYGRRHVFVMRFEDLCFNTFELLQSLDLWLPGLGDADVLADPGGGGGNKKHGRTLLRKVSHDADSIPLFCYNKFLPELPYHHAINFTTTDSDEYDSLLRFFKYSASVSSSSSE